MTDPDFVDIFDPDPDFVEIVTMLRAPDRLEPCMCAAADEIERLTTERDEARREVLNSMHPDLRKSHAAARGWDCFKEDGNG